MFFEGSEKKIELVVTPGAPSLRQLGHDFWASIVSKCRAQVLSIISNDYLDAYLLSESSLFVWEDRFLMITCGRTVLINSLLEFIKVYDQKCIECLIFQRKNEYDSREQITSFLEDISKLRASFPGVALRFGKLDGHYNYLFHLDKDYGPSSDDHTAELLMYHIEGDGAKYLLSDNQTAQEVRKLLGLERLIPDAKFDDHLFEPFGYSMNAIIGDRYLTMHITPQEESSYVSFETDIDVHTVYSDILPHLIQALNPGSFDLVTFNLNLKKAFLENYIVASNFKESLSCGYTVDFKHYHRKDEQVRRAWRL